jgi:hypothetical protein
MSSGAKDVENALHEETSVPGNFNLETGKWERFKRTICVFISLRCEFVFTKSKLKVTSQEEFN